MVLCTLINISVDLSASITWWILKNTLYGTYYMGYYLANRNRPRVPTEEEILLLELRNQFAELNTTIINNQLTITPNDNMDEDFVIITNNDYNDDTTL
jgi:hypothetical protein